MQILGTKVKERPKSGNSQNGMLATEAARNPLARSNMTSPLHSRGHMNVSTTSFGSSHHSGPASQSSRYGSSSTMRSDYNGDQQGLFPPPIFSPPPTSQSELPKPDMNIMNRRAGAESSLYQICMNLRRRLAEVPGFHEHLVEMEEEEEDQGDSTPDPVTLMWNCLRRGIPLMTIYNASRPSTPLEVDTSRIGEAKIGKTATFKFLHACMEHLKIPSNEVFLITDLYGEDTSGFVKVTKIVNKVLDILNSKGLLQHREGPPDATANSVPQILTHRQKIIEEIVKTERDYVQHLEMLQQFQNEVQESGAISGDAVHDIFLNLNALLDFQRRFLIRIEQQNSLEESEQNWGKLFVFYKDSFRVYEPFLANQARCNAAVINDWKKLRAAAIAQELRGMVETPAVLLGFLVKPFQRLSKYPLLLRELEKNGGYEPARQQDLAEGFAAAQSIMDRADEAIGRENRIEAMKELQGRVEDWKGHKIEHFGDLLHFGTYTVLKGEGAKEVEREYKVYLFERILLCCKEINPNKPKNKMLSSNKPLVDKKGKLKLQLKGRIFMQNVTDVVTLKRADQQQYTIQIFWKGDPGVENFVIRFNDEATMKKWQETVQMQKRVLTESARSSGQTGTSATEFSYLRNQSIDNPYREMEEADEDDENQSISTIGQPKTSFAVSRNASSNSLRSGAQMTRMPPPRFPLPDGNGAFGSGLSLNTNIAPTTDSPGEFAGNSYFSPSNDSPISTRSSSQQSLYAFPRAQASGSGWSHDSHKHQTAPAIGRAPSREGPGPPNSYVINGKTVTRPSLPAMAPSHIPPQAFIQAQSRLRSASTPDINNPFGQAIKRQGNGQHQTLAENVPVPPIPPHMAQMRVPINRSQTTSPTEGHLPIRPAPQPSAMHRDRIQHQYQEPSTYDRQSQRTQDNGPRSLPQGYGELQMQPTDNITSPDLSENGMQFPAQLKVTVWFDPNPSHVTIVVPSIIKHRTLVDRIDSKMAKVSAASIAKGTARLRYKDSDGDIVTIRSDEDVHLAIEDWGTVNEQSIRDGIIPDFELYWQSN